MVRRLKCAHLGEDVVRVVGVLLATDDHAEGQQSDEQGDDAWECGVDVGLVMGVDQ